MSRLIYSFSVKYRVMIYHCERKSIKDMIYSTPDNRSDGDDLELSHPTDEKTDWLQSFIHFSVNVS